MITIQTGTLLIAEPFLKDPNFSRSVIFLCDHHKEGSFGLVINKSLKMTLDQIINAVHNTAIPVFYGGPVQTDTLHFLHNLPDIIPGSEKVSEDIYWGGDFDLVIKLLNKDALDLNKIRFYLGYSGWAEGQLFSEMKESKSWLTLRAKDYLIFQPDPNQIWANAITALGGDYVQLKNYPLDPQLN
jgi:putative transcriptional regulator